MADQRLRLIAEMKDSASPKIRQIGKELKEITRTPGMEAATKWMTGFSEAASGFVKDGAGISATMGSIGIGGITAAASLAGLVSQFKELGDHSFAMKRLGQEAKMSIAEVSKWEYVGKVFRVPQEQMDGALKTFGEQMRLFAQRRGELFGKLSDLDPAETKKLLGIKDADLQFQEVLRYISQTKDAALQNQWMTTFLGGDALGALLTDGFPKLQEAIAEAKKNAVVPTEEFQRQADLLNKSIIDFDSAWSKFEVSVGPAVFNQLRLAADDFRDVFKEITGDVGAVVAAIKPLTDWLAKEDGKSLPKMTGDAVKDVAKELKRSRDEISTFGNNGDPGLHGDDSSGPAKPATKRGWFGGLFGGSVQKSAYVTGLDGGSFGGGRESNDLSDGVKEGVLAAFREWAAENAVQKAAGGGLVKASYETGMGGGGFGGGFGGGGGGNRGLGGANLTGGDATGEHADFIRSIAAKLGIDQRLAVAVAKSEGLGAGYGVGDHGTSFGDFQLHRGGLADIFERETHLRANDPANWKAADEWALRYASKNGWGSWHGAAKLGVRGMMGIGGRAVSSNAAGGASMPGHIGGKLKIGDESFNFGSGGAGNASIPLGDYPITPGTIGAWGQSHGALGINNNHIWDKALGRMRAGIEMHAGSTAALITEGCVAFDRQQWPHVKDKVLGMISREGGAYLHVGKDGASITSHRSLVEEASKAAAAKPGSTDGSIEAHVHIHDGQVRGASARSSGAVKPPQVHLRRAPMMTQA